MLDILITALVAASAGGYGGYRVGRALYEVEGERAETTDRAPRDTAPFRIDHPQTPPRGFSADGLVTGGLKLDTVEYYDPPSGVVPLSAAPVYRIVRDDGAILFENTNGGKALRAWEALTQSGEPLAAGVTFLHDGLVRGRVGASA